ncbi:DMT family transporter [Ralstonia sp. GX3-BWBA]|uniref:DMT family transporter n=1 Tax=Ralstonia sp. GX3-BWBA TaxID=2219865 RepID=UPI000DD45FE5|nr:DMT family transporter [Ralstonia sp. GX3-BWBA]
MTPAVIALVLCAALLHASWNALLKSGSDRLRAITLMTLASGVAAIPMAIALPLPSPAAWPYVALSAVLHVGYNVFLARAYRFGEFGQVYPIARGSSPLLVTMGAALFAGEMPGVIALAGVVLVSGGILSLARGRKADLGSTLAALTTGVFIACYTVCDGIGARAAGNANAYSAWLFMLDSLPMVLLYRVWKGPLNIDLRDATTLKTFGGGVVSLVAYGIVIWAVTLAPMGPVSALRETSVVFAALLGRLFLKESLTARRLSACSVIAFGAYCLGHPA